MMKSLAVVALTLLASSLHAADPLPSWNDAATKGWTVVDMKQDWGQVFLPAGNAARREKD